MPYLFQNICPTNSFMDHVIHEWITEANFLELWPLKG